MKHLIKSALQSFGYDIVKYSNLVKKPMDESHLEVLADPAFQASVNEVKKLTLLDTARLANLWQLCRMSNPSGSLIEIGSYKGGGRFIFPTVRQRAPFSYVTHSKDSET
jgi:hypothetical protein